MAQADKDWERSVRHLRAALAVFRADRVPAGQAVSLYWLGHASQAGIPAHENVRPDPVRCYGEALELFTDLGNAMGANWCRVSLGTCAFFAGDLDRAEQLANQVVDDCLATGIRHPLGQAWSNLADIARRRGDETTTLALLRDAAGVYRDHGDPWSLATTLTDLAAQQVRMGSTRPCQIWQSPFALPRRSAHLPSGNLRSRSPPTSISPAGGERWPSLHSGRTTQPATR